MKVEYNGKTFDSELEVEYYKYLEQKTDVLRFIYHPKQIPNFVGKRSYTPDFIVQYQDHWEIVECKGYNPYSKMIDDQIHTIMQQKDETWLRSYIQFNGYYCIDIPVKYVKVKYLKAYGFVDWDFKNPNTIANKRKAKINDLNSEIKDLREFKKNAERYFKYHLKIVKNEKLTKQQKEWYYNYVKELQANYGEQ